MSVVDELLANNEAYAAAFDKGGLPGRPTLGFAVVACMDARIDAHRVLGLSEGDAHVIRNAGGLVTEDVLRSLIVSQWLLDTTEIVLIHHTDCGMLALDEEGVAARIESATGARPPFALGAISDLEASVQRSIAVVKESPYVLHPNVRGFIYHVEDGTLHEVE